MNKFPSVLWILPICFGMIGGLAAALIASLKYQASWWELFAAGCIVSFVAIVGYFVFAIAFFL